MPLTMTETDKAYLAGLMDGEGSISLARSFAKRTRGRYVYPLVRIANTDKPMIDWIIQRIPFGALQYRSRMNERCKNVYHIGWASSEAIEVLELILPYLITKKERAIIVIDLWNLNKRARDEAGGYFGHGHPIPDWLTEKRSEAFDQMAILNKRGVA